MIKHLTILFISLFLLAGVAKAQTGFLHTSGKKVLDSNGEEVILRGMGLGGWMLQEGYMLETNSFANPQYQIRDAIKKLVGEEATQDFYDAWLENYCQKKDIDSMAAWGFNSIRLPMHYNLFTLPIEEEPVAGQDTWLEKGFQMVDDLLDWCEDNEIYLILDLHAAPGGQGKDAAISDYNPAKLSLWESAENRRKTVALWKKLAERYANEPWIGAYDLINEPNWDIDNAGDKNGCDCKQNTALWNLYKEIIREIRTVDNNHIVILEGNCWGNNYNGLTNIRSFDSNLMLSFHKYWNYTDVSSIQNLINLRNTHNVPLWLGESGENSNTWFTNTISMVESNGIGWAWWPYKKISSVTGTVTIPKTTGWQRLLNYWKGSGSKPSAEQATTWLMEQVEMLKLENCVIHRDVVDAMFRQVQSKETLPFKEHTAPGTIYATDFDLGRNGFAFLDSDTADYHVSTGTYTAWNSGYAYRNDAVDIEACSDAAGNNGYNVGWTANGEWLLYTVTVEETAAYSVDLRYAAQGSSGKFHLELDGISVSPQVSLAATGGWATWGTKTINNVILKEGEHKLKLYVDNSGFNINFLRIHSPVAISTVNPEILNIKTDTEGKQIRITSNLGFDPNSLPATDDFQIKVNSSFCTVESMHFDETNPEILVLETDGSLISIDRIYLTYTGNSLKSPGQTAYATFSNKVVSNNSPVYVSLPGKIQAEDYVYNKGFQTETCTDTGGGVNLSYANAGDYTEYDVFLNNNGLYRFEYRVASEASGRFELRLVEDNAVTTLHSVNVTTSGGWQTWKTVTAEANLKKGKNRLRFYVVSGEFNTNWFSVSTITGVDDIRNENRLIAVFDSRNNAINLINKGFSEENCTVSCFDLNGKRMFDRKLTINGNITPINGVSLSKGLYLLRFEARGNSFSQKLKIQ